MVSIRQIIFGCLVGTLLIFGQEEFEISASLSRSKIYQNEMVTLTLSVKGADKDLYKNINQPELSEMFTIISTSQSSSFSFINGVSNRTRQYKYNLRPNKAGIFIIDPFKVSYNGKQFTTKPLRLVIREGNVSRQSPSTSPTIQPQPSTQPQQTKSIFIETQISTNNIFIGESIDYSVKLYRRIRILSSVSISQEDMQDVWQTSYDVTPERIVRKNGQRYYELELIKKKISPLNVGEFTIPQLFARFIVDPFSGEYQLASDIITLNVNELPSPKPLSFTGAIGSYEMNVSSPEINKESNAFQIQVMIQGTGNLATISPPVIQDTKEYRVLSAPKSLSEVLNNQQIFDYVIIPKVTGEITIPPIEFSYFSKTRNNYVALKSPSLNLTVALDNLNPNNTLFNAQEDIHFLKKNNYVILALLNNPKATWIGVILNLIIVCFLFLDYIKRNAIFSSKNRKNSRKKLVRSIYSITDDTSLTSMEKILVNVLKTYTGYQHPGINPKDVELSLIKAKLSDPLIKGTMQWIKNTQLLRYSKDKISQSNHSNSESLKRILKNIVNEKESK